MRWADAGPERQVGSAAACLGAIAHLPLTIVQHACGVDVVLKLKDVDLGAFQALHETLHFLRCIPW